MRWRSGRALANCIDDGSLMKDEYVDNREFLEMMLSFLKQDSTQLERIADNDKAPVNVRSMCGAMSRAEQHVCKRIEGLLKKSIGSSQG